MLIRLLLVFVLMGSGFAMFCLLRCWATWRMNRQTLQDPILHNTRQDTPVIVYFTTPTCAPCRFAQRPALSTLQQELGDKVQVIQIDVTEQPDVAERWHVQTVPTTVILDNKRTTQAVNFGVADIKTLRQQVLSL